jgi:hypothetical protein
MATIDQEAKSKREEFYQMFDSEYKPGVSIPDAYEKAEGSFIAKYKHRAYSNFQCFNVAKFRKTKRELGK